MEQSNSDNNLRVPVPLAELGEKRMEHLLAHDYGWSDKEYFYPFGPAQRRRIQRMRRAATQPMSMLHREFSARRRAG